MNWTRRELKQNLRIISAIAFKDIVDAIKNKITISVILGVALLMLSSQALPLIAKLSTTHRLVVYDAGASRLVSELKRNRELGVSSVSSQGALEEALGESSGTVLGLVLPAGFDEALDAGAPPELDGFFAHWVSRADANEEQAFFEQRLAELAGQRVRVTVEGNVVYPGPDSTGQPFMVSLTLVIFIITISAFLVPYLIIEEKENKTMDALLVSPARISQVVIGKAIAGMVYGLSAACVAFAFNRVVVVHWGWAFLAAICGTLFGVAVGLALGTFFDNPQNLNLSAGLIFIVLLTPLFLGLAGSNQPELLSAITPWVPTVALSKVLRISFSRSVPLGDVLTNLAVVVGSAVLLLTAVVWVVRRSDR